MSACRSGCLPEDLPVWARAWQPGADARDETDRLPAIASVRRVSSLSIRRQLRRHRRDLALIAALLALGGAIAVHHSGAFVDVQHHIGVNAAVEMCLAVFTAVGVALVTAAVAGRGFGGWRPALQRHATAALTVPGVPVARARHGPAAVSVLCVSRR